MLERLMLEERAFCLADHSPKGNGLQSFIRRIEVTKDEIRIEYTLPRPKGRKLDLMELDLVPSMGSPGTPGRI